MEEQEKINAHVQATFFCCETQYLPPVSQFVMFLSNSEIVIDGEENFKKSTWRNRCRIVGANGIMMLTIPVIGGRGVKSKSKEVRIANDEPWQQRHWKSIRAAYGKSSFFYFYEERFQPFYEKKFEFLIDFNVELLQVCFDVLKWEKRVVVSRESEVSSQKSKVKSQKPKAVGQNFKTYHQVFIERHGFIPELSIVDLIFNLGPEAGNYLADASGKVVGSP